MTSGLRTATSSQTELKEPLFVKLSLYCNVAESSLQGRVITSIMDVFLFVIFFHIQFVEFLQFFIEKSHFFLKIR